MLEFRVTKQHKTVKARTGCLVFNEFLKIKTPVFMPVGTQGCIKGLLPSQVNFASCSLILGNTYHLGQHPNMDSLFSLGGMHRMYCWKGALLTDSGGFQMVSLLKFSNLTEQGVDFIHPKDGSKMLLTPELSMELQNSIGANIIMQLDDVVNPKVSFERLEEAVKRSGRWLKRAEVVCKEEKFKNQNLFPIIQGGTHEILRDLSIKTIEPDKFSGIAIGGLCGGENKDDFWKTISFCTDRLRDKPVYSMGVGYLIDIMVCISLGVDMFDCVYPTRTARFGTAFVRGGTVSLKNSEFEDDFSPICPDCSCYTCKNYSRAYLHAIVTRDTVGCHLITIHNIAFYMRFIDELREAINGDYYEKEVKIKLSEFFKDNIPSWIIAAFSSINIDLTK
jgi:queuine tRNA-ribosyltransferase catalytic subunit